MGTNILHLLSPNTLLNCTKPCSTIISPPPLPTPVRRFSFQICSTNNRDGNGNGNDSSITTETTTGIRFRRGSKKRGKTLKEEENGGKKTMVVKKKWEEMSMAEKGMELYVGEKGALFWLNKFAYTSIYIMIAAWICFRFVGPALNLYHLDNVPNGG